MRQSEPMEIAMRLLKEGEHPFDDGESMWAALRNDPEYVLGLNAQREHLEAPPLDPKEDCCRQAREHILNEAWGTPYEYGNGFEEGDYSHNPHHKENQPLEHYDCDELRNFIETEVKHIFNEGYGNFQGPMKMGANFAQILDDWRKCEEQQQPNMEDEDWQSKIVEAGEPMDIAYQLLKEGPTQELVVPLRDAKGPPETDELLDVDMSVRENPCCEEVKRQVAEDRGDNDVLDLDCDGLRQILQDLGANWDGVNPYHAGRYLQMWDECEATSHPTDDPLFTAGEPMDIAMQLLKATRQTELGEFHPDFPSSHGPVTGYRALSNEQRDNMIHEGLKATPIDYNKFGANPDTQAFHWFGSRYTGRLRPKNAVWAWLAHNKKGHEEAKKNAQWWADQQNQVMTDFETRTLRQGIPSSVVGIRGQHESIKDRAMHDPTGNYPWENDDWSSYGPVAITQDIPPEQTVRMNKSFDFIKRQTELGEFHEDFPSSQGPVTEYHGTMNMPGVLSEEGIRGGPTKGRSKKWIPKELQDEDKIVYTTLMRERALQFAQDRAKDLGLSPDKVGVVGVRGGGLSEPSKLAEGNLGQALSGTVSNVRAGGIPRRNIVSL